MQDFPLHFFICFFQNPAWFQPSAFTLSTDMALYIEALNPPTERWPLMPTIPFDVAKSRKSFSSSAYSGVITKVTFMRERSSGLVTVGTNNLFRSSSAIQNVCLFNIHFFHGFHSPVFFQPAQGLQTGKHRKCSRCIEHRFFLNMNFIIKHCWNRPVNFAKCLVFHNYESCARRTKVFLCACVNGTVFRHINRTAKNI
jgi:hypothetical protein